MRRGRRPRAFDLDVSTAEHRRAHQQDDRVLDNGLRIKSLKLYGQSELIWLCGEAQRAAGK